MYVPVRTCLIVVQAIRSSIMARWELLLLLHTAGPICFRTEGRVRGVLLVSHRPFRVVSQEDQSLEEEH